MGGGIHVERDHLVAGVDASCQEDAGLAAVEIGGAEEELHRAVAVAVAPCGVEVALATLEALQGELLHHVGLARLAVHVDQELVAFAEEVVDATAIILRGVANGVGSAVGHVDDAAVLQAGHTLGLAVAVPVVGHDVDLILLEIPHVGAAVDPPEQRAVELLHLDACEVGL